MNKNDTPELEKHTEIPQQGVIIPLPVRCGNCYHFKQRRADVYSDVCEKLGILVSGRPCVKFLNNPKTFDFKDSEHVSLADIINNIPSNGLVSIAALISQERVTRKHGYRLGELVYVRVYPDDFLSNYSLAWVIQADKNRVFVQGKNKNFRAEFLQSSVFDGDTFSKKKKVLINRGLLIDPKLKEYTRWRPKITKKEVEQYIPPTIDSLHTLDTPKIKVKRKLTTDVINIRRG